MVFPTVVGGPRLTVTADPSSTGFVFPIPVATYQANDTLLFVASGGTKNPPPFAGVSGAFWVDGPPWKPGVGSLFPMATRLHEGDSTGVVTAGDLMAGAAVTMGFRDATVSMAGFVETDISSGASPISITVNPSFAETTARDRLCYLFIGAFRYGPSPAQTPGLTPAISYSGILSSDYSWTEIATDPATFVHMYELDGGIPAGTIFDGTENYATFEAFRNGYSDGCWIDAVIVHAAYEPPISTHSSVRKRQRTSQERTVRRGTPNTYSAVRQRQTES